MKESSRDVRYIVLKFLQAPFLLPFSFLRVCLMVFFSPNLNKIKSFFFRFSLLYLPENYFIVDRKAHTKMAIALYDTNILRNEKKNKNKKIITDNYNENLMDSI